MKEIKFRAWAVASNKMFYPETDNGWEIINGKLNPLPNTILMQYTGLKDKNSKDIYESDMCIIFSNDEYFKQIIFLKGAFGYFYDGDFITLAVNWYFNWMHCQSKHIEVIGNIYENPELI